MRVTKTDQIVAGLRSRIASGEYGPSDPLPSLRKLMEIYSTPSKGTVERAVRVLIAEGLLTVRQGSGTYVRHREPVRRNLTRTLRLEYQHALDGNTGEGIFEASTGLGDVDVTATYEQVAACRYVAQEFGVDEGSPLLERTYFYTVAKRPHQIVRSYLPVEVAESLGLTGPEVEGPGFGIVYRFRTIGVIVDHATVAIEARMPTEIEAERLAMTPGTPVVEVWRTMRADGRPVEVTNGVVPGDQVAHVLEVNLKGTD